MVNTTLTTLQIKRSSTQNVPVSLANGELAYSFSSNTLFIGSPANTPITILPNTVLQAVNTAANGLTSLNHDGSIIKPNTNFINFNDTSTINVTTSANSTGGDVQFDVNTTAVAAQVNNFQVDILANGSLICGNANVNFNNSASVNVVAGANGSGQANIAFVVNTAGLTANSGGANTQIQFNNLGSLSGSPNLKFDLNGNIFSVLSSANIKSLNVSANIANAGNILVSQNITSGNISVTQNIAADNLSATTKLVAPTINVNTLNATSIRSDNVMTVQTGTGSNNNLNLGANGVNYWAITNVGYLIAQGDQVIRSVNAGNTNLTFGANGTNVMFITNTSNVNIVGSLGVTQNAILGNIYTANINVSAVLNVASNLFVGNIQTLTVKTGTGSNANLVLGANGVNVINITNTQVVQITGSVNISSTLNIGVGTIPQWVHVRTAISYSAFSNTLNSNTITLFTLPAAGVIHGIKIKQSTAFTGPNLNTYFLSIGNNTNPTKYAAYYNVTPTAANDTFFIASAFGSEDHANAVPISITANSVNANLQTVTAGVVDVWALLSVAN